MTGSLLLIDTLQGSKWHQAMADTAFVSTPTAFAIAVSLSPVGSDDGVSPLVQARVCKRTLRRLCRLEVRAAQDI